MTTTAYSTVRIKVEDRGDALPDQSHRQQEVRAKSIGYQTHSTPSEPVQTVTDDRTAAAALPVDQLFRRNQLVRVGRRLFRAGSDPAAKGLRLRSQTVEAQVDQGLGPLRAAYRGRLSVSPLRLCRQHPPACALESQPDQQHVDPLAQTEVGADDYVHAESRRGATSGACAGQAFSQWRSVTTSLYTLFPHRSEILIVAFHRLAAHGIDLVQDCRPL